MKMNYEVLQWNINKNTASGGTYSLEGKAQYFKSGYMVGITKLIDLHYYNRTQEHYTFNEVATLVKNLNKEAINKVFNKVFIGFWKFEGKTYCDIVVKINTKKEATQIAKQAKEIAIWSNKAKKEIFINN